MVRVGIFGGVSGCRIEVEQFGIPLGLLASGSIDADAHAGIVTKSERTTGKGEWAKMDWIGRGEAKFGTRAEFRTCFVTHGHARVRIKQETVWHLADTGRGSRFEPDTRVRKPSREFII